MRIYVLPPHTLPHTFPNISLTIPFHTFLNISPHTFPNISLTTLPIIPVPHTPSTHSFFLYNHLYYIVYFYAEQDSHSVSGAIVNCNAFELGLERK